MSYTRFLGFYCAFIVTMSLICIHNDPVYMSVVKPEKVREVMKPLLQPVIKKIPVTKKIVTNEFDIDRFAHAVAKHETGDCKKGNSASRNNCFGIREWKNGKPHYKSYVSKEASYEDFKKIWINGYGGGLPTMAKAKKYSGNDRSEIWLKNVLFFYGS